MAKRIRVLALDDDTTQLELLKVVCGAVDYPEVELFTATHPTEGYEIVQSNDIDLVLTDFRLPGESGLDVLRRVKQINPLIAVVVITAFESTQEAVDLMKSGADDYLVKPIRKTEIEHLLVRMAEQLALTREDSLLKAQVDEHFDPGFIIYRSREMTELLNLAARSAASSATVLIRGESGTGKELIAQLIHHTSDRKDGPFVTVNVAALPETLVESELFGHRKGAFTGATEDRIGRFSDASGGTLFIDEVGDITPAVQVKLLRAIQFGEAQRLGDNRPVSFDVRIIAATNRNLEEMIARKEFRSDLFYRLNVVPLNIPPLRERKHDIPALAEHFIERFARKNRRSVEGLSHEALDLLMKYDYPGNVRELENIVERAVVLARSSTITLRDLPEYIAAGTRVAGATRGNAASAGNAVSAGNEASSGAPHVPTLDDVPDGGLPEFLERLECRLIQDALEKENGNQSAASRRLGISERRLRSRLEVLGIENPFR